MIRPVTCFLAFLSLSIFYAYGGKKYLVETNDEEANGTTPVDGKWNDWGSWSACHNGMRYRFRKCNNPPPKNGGRCTGKSYQEEPCPDGPDCQHCPPRHDPVCGVDGKTYDNDCFATCKGVSVDCHKICPCGPVPPPGDWGEWTPWSDCDKTLNKMFRTRECHKRKARNGAASCPGPSVETQDCPPNCHHCSNRHDPVCGVDGKEYKNDCWATCKRVLVDCHRKCPCDVKDCTTDNDCYKPGKTCYGWPRGTCTCRNGICIRDGNWGEWTPWSDCDKSLKKMFRTRKCNNPTPSNGGASCPGSSVQEQTCEGCQHCPPRHDPVCGVDGKTYDNDCLATCKGVSVDCHRKCPCGPDCHHCSNRHDPVCGVDGK